jgi:DNA-binding transcriptional regulator LsrR (DeoR family)
MKMEHWDLVAQAKGYPSIKQLLEDLYLTKGLSKENIANELEIHRVTVQRLMQVLGIVNRKRELLTISHKEAVNLTVQQISKRYHVTKSTAWRAKLRALKDSLPDN